MGLKWPTLSSPMLSDLAQVMLFWRMNSARKAPATSMAIHGSMLVLPTLRKKDPSRLRTRASSTLITPSHAR